MSLQIRPATTDDLHAAVTLLRARDLPTDGFADLLRAHPQHVLLAELNGAVVGSAALDVHDNVALLRSVAVARDLAALGVGTRLVNDLIALARASDITTLYLLTTTAEQWFPKFGFTVIDRASVPPALAATVEFTSACPSSAVVMRCDL
ncbi:MAG: GNAT family N-acetyltransferase [Gemmatimonadaceae bacterium]|nr:GNAT family N-acetyltransferase [Gemmatimonadaceae bacterium]